jgi:hypothetical protein
MAEKRSKEEMISLAYDLQNAIVAFCGHRPLRITTNKDFKLLRVVWMQGYERKEWYNGVGMKILLAAFSDKHHIQVCEITAEESKESAVWLTKAENDPAKHGNGR